MVTRVSGVYVARLVVPLRLRALMGKRELVQSTGSRELAEAKVLASQIQAGWRRALREAERTAHVNVLQLKAGSPNLSLGGYLPLIEASEASGLDPSGLLRHAVQGQLSVLLEPGDGTPTWCPPRT
jgi:hypothetical protein